MALYRPDLQLIKAQKIVKELGDSEKDEAIKYFIKDKDRTIESMSEQLKEYNEFFRMMDKFLPNHNAIYR